MRRWVKKASEDKHKERKGREEKHWEEIKDRKDKEQEGTEKIRSDKRNKGTMEMRKERKNWLKKKNHWGTLPIVPYSRNNFDLFHSSLKITQS